MINTSDYKNIKLQGVQVAKDELGRYGLHIEYRAEKRNGDIDLITIPNVELNIPVHDFPMHKIEQSPFSYGIRAMVDIGQGWQEALPGPVITKNGKVDAIWVTETISKKTPKKMTLKEVEEKLGCRIELVSEEEKKDE